jgi:hypothetical protein
MSHVFLYEGCWTFSFCCKVVKNSQLLTNFNSGKLLLSLCYGSLRRMTIKGDVFNHFACMCVCKKLVFEFMYTARDLTCVPGDIQKGFWNTGFRLHVRYTFTVMTDLSMKMCSRHRLRYFKIVRRQFVYCTLPFREDCIKRSNSSVTFDHLNLGSGLSYWKWFS